MLTDFQNSFTNTLSSKFLGKQWLNIPQHLKCIATLLSEMFVLKNCNDPQSWLNRISKRDSAIQNGYWKIFNQWFSVILFTNKKIFSNWWHMSASNKWLILHHHHHHNRFTALFPGPPGYTGARRELLDFMVQGKINRGRHTDYPAGCHSIRTNQCPPPPSSPSRRPSNSVKALKATSAFGLGRRR